jgi:hypothetical protein
MPKKLVDALSDVAVRSAVASQPPGAINLGFFLWRLASW